MLAPAAIVLCHRAQVVHSSLPPELIHQSRGPATAVLGIVPWVVVPAIVEDGEVLTRGPGQARSANAAVVCAGHAIGLMVAGHVCWGLNV